MRKMTIDLDHVLPGGANPEYFANVLSYYNDKVDSVDYAPRTNQLIVTYPGSTGEIESILEEIKEKLGRSVINRGNEVVYIHSQDTPVQEKDMWKELIRQGMVFDYGQGHVAYGGVFLELFEALDDFLKDYASRFSARPIHLPNFISTRYIKKLGLVDEFPQYLFFVTPLAKKISIMENFQQEDFIENPSCRHYLENPEFCLKTAACSLLYPTLENENFSTPAYFTMRGMVSRRESFNVNSFERLTEFHQREIVFVGNEASAKEFEASMLTLLEALIDTFQLNASIETANDSFFVSNYNKLRLMQLLGHDKYEALARIPSTGANIAFASFNNHRSFFSKRFNFSFNGAEAMSACMGVGLERLVYAIICHHGLERSTLFDILETLKERCSERRTELAER